MEEFISYLNYFNFSLAVLIIVMIVAAKKQNYWLQSVRNLLCAVMSVGCFAVEVYNDSAFWMLFWVVVCFASICNYKRSMEMLRIQHDVAAVLKEMREKQEDEVDSTRE